MKIYINIKSAYGIETVDELQLSDFESRKELNKEAWRLVNEYRFSGTAVYTSRRCAKEWRNKS